MIYQLLATISALITKIILASGYFGVFFLMALESASLPVPSEIVMPFSGFLVLENGFSFWLVVLAGTFGNLIGSQLAYAFGYYGGRPLVERYGKFFFISQRELIWADTFFRRYGHLAVFISRLLPVVRTFISLPAGIAKMSFKKFSFYTVAGSLPWNFALTYLGVLMGKNWQDMEIYFRRFDWLIVALMVFGAIWILYKKLKK